MAGRAGFRAGTRAKRFVAEASADFASALQDIFTRAAEAAVEDALERVEKKGREVVGRVSRAKENVRRRRGRR